MVDYYYRSLREKLDDALVDACEKLAQINVMQDRRRKFKKFRLALLVLVMILFILPGSAATLILVGVIALAMFLV